MKALRFIGRSIWRLTKIALIGTLVLIVAWIAVVAILNLSSSKTTNDDYAPLPTADADEVSITVSMPDSYFEYVERQESIAQAESSYAEMIANVTEYTLVTATAGDIFVLEDDDGNLLSVRLSGIEILEDYADDAKSYSSLFLPNYALRIEYDEEVYDEDGNLYVELYLMANIYYPERNYRNILLTQDFAKLAPSTPAQNG